LKAARALVDMSQATLAREAGVTEQTLRRYDAKGIRPTGGHGTTMNSPLQALGRHGVVLTPLGVQLISKSENPDTPAPRFAPDATSQVHPLANNQQVYLR
jgi:hypothetical protein